MVEETVIRVALADDHPIVREGLRAMLSMEPAIELVGEAMDGVDAIRVVKEASPDLLLLDLAMPRMGGLDVLREIAGTSVRVVIFAAEISRDAIAAALRLGARGVLLKDAASATVLKCIRCVMAGQQWVGREMVSDLLKALAEHAARPAEAPRNTFRLTPRELQVVSLVVAGYTNRDIAETFQVSIDTVKHHLTNIFDKTGASNRLELALFATHHRLV
jgi:two-component system, NarL family, nitrate/nitrite response regulator NarL